MSLAFYKCGGFNLEHANEIMLPEGLVWGSHRKKVDSFLLQLKVEAYSECDGAVDFVLAFADRQGDKEIADFA